MLADGKKIKFAPIKPPPLRIRFLQGDEEIGVLENIDGKLVFIGNADKSAEIFFEHIIKKWEKSRAIHNSN